MLVTSLNDATYYVNKLPPTTHSLNQYVYLSGFEGSVDIINEQWVFDFKVYLNGDFNVPTNTLYADLYTPFAKKEQVPLVQQKITTNLPDYVDKSTKTNLYIFNAIIPTGGSEYFNPEMINRRINIDLGFYVNPDYINKTEIPEDIRSDFIKEFDGIKTSTNVNYTNFHSGEDQGSGSIVDSYYVVNDSFKVVNPRHFSWYLNEDCLDLTTPLKSIIDIDFEGNFTVNGYNIEFVYSVDGEATKTKSHKDTNPVYCQNNFHLDLPVGTTYDDTKKEIEWSEGPYKGFYIPKNASGYYTVTLLLLTRNNGITLKVTNNFNFIADSSLQTQLKVEQHFIKSLENYKRMVI